MYRIILCVLTAIFVLGCAEKQKVSMKGEEAVEAADFIDFFPSAELPVTIADSSLARKDDDSALISHKIFSGFIPDSVFKKDFTKGQPKLYALGKVREKNKEWYLFFKAVQGTRRVAYIATFDNNNQFLKAMPLVRKGFDNIYSYAHGSLDRKFQLTIYREKKTKTGESNFKRNVYIYNSASKDFTLILTEPNEDIIEEIINPIDTLPQKHKYTGDYVANKKNFIAFRDGRKQGEILFFVHFEKNKGECRGELKGTARFVSAKKAVYNQSGNPCTLEFSFTASSVVMKELEGCGSYRDIKCFFEGTYPKKKKKK